MAVTLLKSDNFEFIALRVGVILRRLVDTKEVYFQPGDDETSIRDQIDAIEAEVAPNKQNAIIDMIASEYFA